MQRNLPHPHLQRNTSIQYCPERLQILHLFNWHLKLEKYHSYNYKGICTVTKRSFKILLWEGLFKDILYIHTANEWPVIIKFKCSVHFYVFPEMKLLFPNQNYNVFLPSSYTHTVYLWEVFIFPGRSAYSAAGKYVDWSWEYINRSQTHECGNWDWGRTIPEKEYINGIFPAVPLGRRTCELVAQGEVLQKLVLSRFYISRLPSLLLQKIRKNVPASVHEVDLDWEN